MIVIVSCADRRYYDVSNTVSVVVVVAQLTGCRHCWAISGRPTSAAATNSRGPDNLLAGLQQSHSLHCKAVPQ